MERGKKKKKEKGKKKKKKKKKKREWQAITLITITIYQKWRMNYFFDHRLKIIRMRPGNWLAHQRGR